MKDILIVGDSFSADWTVKYPERKGWVNTLADKHNVVNLSQAGCSQYAILKQLETIETFLDFDAVLVSHTSPYRVYVEHHPIHDGDSLHGNADLIYSDIQNAAKTDSSLLPLKEYMEKYMSLEYQLDIYDMICDRIEQLLFMNRRGLNIIHMTHLEWIGRWKFDNLEDFSSSIWKKHRGDINHYTEEGNDLVLEDINKRIDNPRY